MIICTLLFMLLYQKLKRRNLIYKINNLHQFRIGDFIEIYDYFMKKIHERVKKGKCFIYVNMALS